MKAVLITGGASGLGKALVERFLADGWRVAVIDLRPDPHTRASPSSPIDRFLYEAGDAADPATYERILARMDSAEWELTCVIGNAALWDYSRALLDMSPETLSAAFEELFHVNVKGYLMAARMTASRLAAARGSLVFTLSNAALYAGGGGPLYTASKHAGVGLVRQLAHELAPAVRVNAVAPAGMATNLAGPPSLGLDKVNFADVWDAQAFASRVPLDFVPDVADYVEAFVFLADRRLSKAITGIVLPVELGLGVRGIRSVSGGVRLDSEPNL